MFTVYYIVKNEVYSFINFNTCLFPKFLYIMYGGVHFQECYNIIKRGKLFKYGNNICLISTFTVSYKYHFE